MANVDSQKKQLKMLCLCLMLFFPFTASVPIVTGSTTTQSPSLTTAVQTDNGQIGTEANRSSVTGISEDKNVLLSEIDHKVQDTNEGVVNRLIAGMAEKKNNTETTTTTSKQNTETTTSKQNTETTSKQNIENKETATSQSVNQVDVTKVQTPSEKIDNKTRTEIPGIMPININNFSTKKTYQESVTTAIKSLKASESESHLSVDDNLSGKYIEPYNLVTGRKNNNDETTSTVSTTTTTTTQSTSIKVTTTTSNHEMKETATASEADIWRSDWDDDSNENEESVKKTDEDDDWNIVEDGKDESLLPVGDQMDNDNDIADKFGDFWDERAFNKGPYIKEGLVTLIPDKEERKIENEISMITYYSWILFFTFLLLTVFVFFRQRHIFSAYWSWTNGHRTRHSSGSEEGKSLMKNVYA